VQCGFIDTRAITKSKTDTFKQARAMSLLPNGVSSCLYFASCVTSNLLESFGTKLCYNDGPGLAAFSEGSSRIRRRYFRCIRAQIVRRPL
jgi:hypothetical protein